MASIGKSSGRLMGGALAALAGLVALTSGPAHAAGGGTISGIVAGGATVASLEETVVFVRNVPGATTPGTATVDRRGMTFIPHLLAITAGDTVNFQNHDGVDHGGFSTSNEGFNLGTFRPNETRSYTFKTPNVGYTTLCPTHPEELGYVFVGQNRYHAPVGADGSFTIKDVPPGLYEVGVWNPKLAAADRPAKVVAGGSTTLAFKIH